MTATACYVLTCAPGARAAEVQTLFEHMCVPRERRVVVTTQPDPIKPDQVPGAHIELFDSDEINIAKWWTQGLEWITNDAISEYETWDILVIESDVQLGAYELAYMRTQLRDLDVAMVGADWHRVLPGHLTGHQVIREVTNPRPPRLPGVALLVKGELEVKHDPQFRWWFVDDDYELQHRKMGGTALLAGVHMEHRGTVGDAGGRTTKLAEEDEPKFLAKWGIDKNRPG